MTTPAAHPRLVFCVAAPAEARAVAQGLEIDPALVSPEPAGAWTPLVRDAGGREVVLLQTGVGKVNAAACVTAYLMSRPDQQNGRKTAVLSVGVAGALPGSPAAIGDTVLATVSLYADEGVAVPPAAPPPATSSLTEGFQDMAAVGFSYGTPTVWPTMGVPASAEALAAWRAAFHAAGLAVHLGPIATISTCAGTDGRAEAVARRTGAIAEAMEGAAIGHAVHRFATHCPELPAPCFGELRVISNTTGDRSRQKWNLSLALAHLAEAVRVITAAV